MTEETKVETTEETPSQEETKVDAVSSEEQPKEEPKSGSDIDNKIDYEAELLKIREDAEKAKQAAAEANFKLREERRKVSDASSTKYDLEYEGEEKPLTASQLEEILAKERQETQRQLQSAKIAEIAKGLSGSDAEAALVMEVHKTRTFPSYLSLEEQVEEAYVIANRKRLLSERNEALRALKNKANISSNSATTHQDAPTASEPQLAASDRSAIIASGFLWNANTRRYEKKLSNGKTLARDQKTKQTYLVQ